MLNKLKLTSVVASLILGLAVFGFAQDRFGEIDGTVSDSNGAVIPNATVRIEGNAFNRTVQANDEGYYRVLAVPPGSYKVTSTASNFADSLAKTITVVLGESTPANITLQPAGSTVQVDVSAGDSIAIDTSSSRVQTNITEKRFEEIPKGTRFSSVLATAPSVQNESKGAGFQIDGASGAENTFIVDGQEVTNFRTGQLQTNNNLPFQLIQEVQIKTGGFEAEHGGATGGVITLVTKRGGNDFNGEIGSSFQLSALDSGPSQILENDPAVLNYINPPEDDFTNFYPSVSLGGPIVKDKLWFFGSYNLQSEITNRTVDYPNGAREEYRLNTRRDYGFFRLDSQIGDKLNLTGSYTYNPVRQHGRLDSVTGLARSVPSDGVLSGREFFEQSGGRRSSTIYNFGGTYTPTSNLIVALRYGEAALNERLGAYNIPNIVRVRCITGNQGVAGVTAAGSCANGFSNVPTVFGTNRDISRRKTFDADATYIVNDFGGRHNFKVGYQLNQLSNDVDQGYVGTGEIRFFFGRSSFGFGTVDGGIGYVYLQRFGAFGNTSSKSQSIFVQDSWTIGRLTINPGVRLEKEDVPSFSDVGVPIIFGWGDKVAPRFGFAYDVFGDGRMKVFGGYGWFYDRFKYELPRGSFGGNTFLRDYRTISAANPNIDDPLYTRDGLIAGGNQFDFRVPSNDPADNRVDPDLDAARQSGIDIGTEFELNENWVLGARYVHKQVDRAIEDVGIFDANGNENFFIANPGFGVVANAFFPGYEPTPAAERKYDAVEVTARKRFSNNYFVNASYTYSRLFGNYSGLASSDENGRSSPNVNRFFDLPFLGFNLDGQPDNGRLATDRPHVFKLNTGYSFDWMGSKTNTTDAKIFFLGQSGTPLSTRVSFYNAGTFVNERGDLGRTPRFTQTDLALTHKYRFGRDNKFTMAFDVDILNLFNQDIITNRFETIFGSSLAASDINVLVPGATDELTAIFEVFNGGIAGAVRELNTRGNAGATTCGDGTESCAAYATDARFNNPSAFQTPRTVRFGFRFTF